MAFEFSVGAQKLANNFESFFNFFLICKLFFWHNIFRSVFFFFWICPDFFFYVSGFLFVSFQLTPYKSEYWLNLAQLSSIKICGDFGTSFFPNFSLSVFCPFFFYQFLFFWLFYDNQPSYPVYLFFPSLPIFFGKFNFTNFFACFFFASKFPTFVASRHT